MQLARSTLRLFNFTAFGVVSVCIIRADEKPKMQAVVAHEYGAPDVLKIERVQRPEPNDDEALVHVAKLQTGQSILIHGGSGGVGSFAVQIAKARGAQVIATASTANQDVLKQLGADVAVDYTKTKFEDVAKDVDAVLDPVGKETLARSYAVVKQGGIVMSLVALPDRAELKKHGIHGTAISVHPDAEDLTEIAQLIDSGKLKPVVTQVLSLNDALRAQQQAATHHTRGKVMLRITDEPKG